MLAAAASLLSLLAIAWLPGAVIYRLPFGDRGRRAALPAEERAFWQVIISLAVSHAVVLGLAAMGRYSFTRLLLADAILALALAAATGFRLKLGAPPPRRPALIVFALIVLAATRVFPPAEYIIGGKDPGTYINEGIVIAQRGTLVYEDPVVRSVPDFARDLFFPSHRRSDYYGTRFMGFFIQDPAAGTVVGQFPHLLPASIAIGYGLDGLTGARRAIGVWAILGVVAVYFAGARWIGRTAAAAAAALLSLNVIEVWYGRYPNAEVVMQAVLFAALLANARAHFDDDAGDRFFGAVAGGLLGLLLFLRFDAVLAIAAVVFANILAGVRGRRITISFVVAAAVTILLGTMYLLGPMRAYATYPIEYVKNLKWWHVTLLVGTGAIATGAMLGAARSPKVRRAVDQILPPALIAIVFGLAIYAFFFRTPAGKLAFENAYALRLYASFYVTVPCLAAALAGYALVTRRRFWDDPATVLTITIFAVFFFYKPRVVAEHFWAARRYLPVILPGTLLFACAAATWGISISGVGPASDRGRTPVLRRALSGAIGLIFVALVGTHYARASAAISEHVEYAGLIPRLEQIAARIGDRDLLLVESRDAGSDAHVFAVPLAYIYARNALVLSSAAPDPTTLTAFLEWARTHYERVYFLGGGGTALLSKRWSASPVSSDRFQVPEYASTFNAYPRGVRQKEFDFGLYALLPPSGNPDMWFDLDVGFRDDLHVVRFHAKETASERTMRWTQDQSFVSITAIPRGAREVVLTMSNGGRPEGPPPADVSVYLNDGLLGTARVTDGFRPYTFALSPGEAEAAAASDTPPRLMIRTLTWNPQQVLGVADGRDLGVMVDRVQVR
jgi:hypothetical protein